MTYPNPYNPQPLAARIWAGHQPAVVICAVLQFGLRLDGGEPAP